MFLDFSTSSIRALTLSSNCPRYFVPASIADISRAITFLLVKISGTRPFAISCAKPSTMAVLPTPASPIKTGLFLVLLQRICITLIISFSLPMTGSRALFFAISVRSRPNDLIALNFWSDFSGSAGFCCGASPIKLGSSSAKMALWQSLISTPKLVSIFAATLSPSRKIPKSMCSVPM